MPNAVIHDELEVAQRVLTLKEKGYIETINKEKLFIEVNTICVHGDNENALTIACHLQQELAAHGILVQ